ncbi:serine/threonine protein kinase [Altericista sp. CCNU0014]|uniref:serine/threonine protein kinase n=1 Tax=Altericista sp. CCNU0014 TaxID=3082949 RepID=UPI0038515811
MRLARSGPNIQIYIDDRSAEGTSGSEAPNLSNLSVEAEADSLKPPEFPEALAAEPAIEETAVASMSPPTETDGDGIVPTPFYVSGRYPLFSEPDGGIPSAPLHPCDHRGAPEGSLICTDCGFPVRPLQAIGPYQVLKSLNPLGNTLIAWRGGHTVVLNTLRPDCRENPDLVRQFEMQAQLLCHLEHPGMPKFFEAFEDGGQPYLASEMIHGPNLRDWIAQRGPMSSYQGVQWALELSRLLDYLHRQTPSYVHRRIQPSNLIRPRIPHGFSQAVLVGFGELQGLSPESGTLSGSGGYRAPEQQIGEDSALSDLYALGATLVYLLTGQEPDAFYRLGDNSFRLQVQEVPNISPEIANIIQKLTHPHPSDRFESAAAVAEALQLLL